MNKIYNGIMGLVVGDALGVPAEFKKRDTYKIGNRSRKRRYGNG